MRIRKFLTILLTLAMVLSLLPQTAFAANNTATTMRLARTQGTVTVTNATNKKVTQTANMKLYNGYKLKTGAKSYAWISLDDTKAVRMDANSVVSVQKSGQKLTLYLSSGNLFFNVKDPLKSGESFQVKTSTMTTGIRGTSGCVRMINDRVTELHLLTGEMEVYTEHPELGISDTKILKAGQKARSMIAEYSMAEVGKQAAIVIEKLKADEVCGICSEAIAESVALQNRIIVEGGFTMEEVERIIAEHEERLAHDEAVADAKEAVLEQKMEQQVFPDEVDPLFEKEKGDRKPSSDSSGGSGSGGSDGGNTGSDPDDAAPVVPGTDRSVRVTNRDDMVNAMADYNTTTDSLTILLDAPEDEDGNKIIEMENADELLAEYNGGVTKLVLDLQDTTLVINEPIINEGNLTITNDDGYIVMKGDNHAVINNNTLTLLDGTIETYSTDGFYDSQTGEYIHHAAVLNNPGATFTMSGGDLKGPGCGFCNFGTANISGGVISSNESYASNFVGIENYGKLNFSGSAEVLLDEDTSDSCGIRNVGAVGYAASGSAGVLNMTGGKITVAGEYSMAIQNSYDFQGGLSLLADEEENDEEERYTPVNTVNGGTLDILGDDSTGAFVDEYMAVNGVEMTVSGQNATGIQFETDADITLSDVTIHVTGQNAAGIYTYYTDVTVESGTITVSGEEAVGIHIGYDSEANFITAGGQNWTIEVYKGTGLYIDGERVYIDSEEVMEWETLENMIDVKTDEVDDYGNPIAVAIRWPEN